VDEVRACEAVTWTRSYRDDAMRSTARPCASALASRMGLGRLVLLPQSLHVLLLEEPSVSPVSPTSSPWISPPYASHRKTPVADDAEAFVAGTEGAAVASAPSEQCAVESRVP